jgi:hypothetical protein
VSGAVPPEADVDNLGAVEATVTGFAQRRGVLVHRRPVREEGWVPQDWTYYIAPAPDGFDLLWIVETFDEGLNDFYCVQQCFRMSGKTNSNWRREIAETPAFSEFDLWKRQEEAGEPLTGLSFVRCQGKWIQMPAIRENVGYRTPLGYELDMARTGGNIEAADLVPYKPILAPATLDCGLAARTDVAGDWVCALYWDRATHVTNHHPADCLHAVVNLGPISPRGKRAISGKIYWMKWSLAELYGAWEKDFGNRR